MKRILPAMLLALSACDLHAPADLLLVMDRLEGGEYSTIAREVPELDDARRLEGELGVGYRGGQLLMDGYRPGGRLDITWTVVDGVAVPLDEDGLILWSFYHHLAGARRDLDERGYDTAALFPVDIAFNPLSVMDFAAAENAAYASSLQTFILFPELVAKEVPLATNAGVVRHEFGHAWFHWLTTGDMLAEPPWLYSAATSALNEGFADTVATTLLDDPRFIEASLNMTDRDVSRDWMASPGLYPTGDESLLDLFDPYPLGTVFASLAWDVRLASDPDTALWCAVSALEIWATEADWDDVDRYAFLLTQVAITQEEGVGAAACEGLSARFPAVSPPEYCP